MIMVLLVLQHVLQVLLVVMVVVVFWPILLIVAIFRPPLCRRIDAGVFGELWTAVRET